MQQTTKHYDLSEHQTLTLAIISDTHGEIVDEVLNIVNTSDAVLHAGDIMDYSVLQKLTPRLGTIIPVRGNNDVPTVWHNDHHTHLAKIPDVAIINTKHGQIAMEHGHALMSIDFDQTPLTYKYPDAKLIVYGHTHIQKLDNTTTPGLLNPGVAGNIRNYGGASCYQLHIDQDTWDLQAYKFAT